MIVSGDPGGGCSSDPLQQFNTAAFQGPLAGSVGLESGNGYLKGCFISSMDLSISRVIRLGGGRSIQLRLDMFNAFNQAGITGRNTTMHLASPAAASTIQNLAFDPIDGACSTTASTCCPRGPESGSVAAEKRRLRRGEQLPDAAEHAGADPVYVLGTSVVS